VLSGKAGNDTLAGGDGGDTLLGGAGADALNGGAGLDYASYGDATVGVGLNLTTGVHTGDAAGDTFVNIERYRLSSFVDTFTGSAGGDYAYGNDGNDTLSGAGGVDKLYGQNDSDTVNGDAGNDILIGGAGADFINGGADRDTASYETMTIGVTVDLAGATSTGDATGDTFSSIEIFWLTSFNDSFIGSTGDDEVRGNNGLDTLNGMNGSDRLRGENDNDTLNGGEGDDFLWGDAGADVLNGGNGTDYACYTYAAAGVSINLATGVHTGEALGDTYTSIERFQLTNQSTQADSFNGSSGDDWVAGYKGADTITGNDGNDTLNGGAHNDVLNGGIGNDKLIAGTGNDSLTGGTGTDQFWFDVALFGSDTVADFENGVDKIRLTGISGVTSFANLTISTNGSGWAVITLPDGSNITLTGITAGLVDASDFLFA
jgi:Ca2+-binding RTX toxin-like protein